MTGRPSIVRRHPLGRVFRPFRATRPAGEPERPLGAGRAVGSGRRAPGFTLIEVLLAVSIFSVVLLSMHLVFYSALRLERRAAVSVATAIPRQQALEVIQRDLANLVIPGGTLSGSLQTTPTTTKQANGQVGPDFYTAAAYIDAETPWGEVERVAYVLAQPTNNSPGKDLYRLVRRNLLSTIEEDPEVQWLLEGVDDLEFLFYDGTQWREDWDSTTEVYPLPSAVKVTITLMADPTRRLPRPVLELIVPVEVQPQTNAVASTTTESQP